MLNIKIKKLNKNVQLPKQGVIVPVPSVQIQEVEELSETSRGVGGFGSTGK